MSTQRRLSSVPAALAALATLTMLAACDTASFGPADGDDVELAALIAEASAGPDGLEDAELATHAGVTRIPGPNGVSVFDQLNSRIDGFAGLYRVGPCSVVLVLAGPADAQHGIRIVRAVVEPLVKRACPSGIRVRVERGEFTYDELRRFAALARPFLVSDDVHAIALDFAANAVRITVASREAAERLAEALESLGVPAAALAFELGGATGTR